ncbi:MAG TPA: biotin/lipoyl-binding protein, partial [Terriglobales bacterium]|nr:biotin/lipoyl-binding protein [Terriglobales bacterium]
MTPAPNLERLKIDRAALGARPRRRRRWLWLALALAAALALWLYLRPGATVVEVARVEPPTPGTGQVVLSAGGYIVAHHTINVNSKVTGRVAWVGVERGDQVRQGQVLVRLEDQEFRAQVVADQGAVAAAQAYLAELTHGSRPQEIAAAQANLQQAQATERNHRLALDRTQALFAKGIVPKSQLDADQAAYDASRQLAASLAQTLELTQVGTRPEEIARAQGALLQAQGNLQYARTLLDATVIRAPVGGTILERTAEKGELITAQFASAVET